MEKRKNNPKNLLAIGAVLCVLFPLFSWAGETPTMVIEEAKLAIDQARKSGAEQKSADELTAARFWLSRAEAEYADAQSFLARMSTSRMKKERDEKIIYLATMAKVRGLAAEAAAKRGTALAELKDTEKDLADFRAALAILTSKVAEAEKAKEIQAKAEAERAQLGEARQKAAAMEEMNKKEFLETQRRAAELEVQRQKELQELRLREAQKAAEREKELAEAKLQAERLAMQRQKEGAEIKAQQEKLAAEKQRGQALQQKTAALEREKIMVAEAGKLPQTTVKAGEKEIVITLLATNIFTPKNELHASGKALLDRVGAYLKGFNNRVKVRGHTDTVGKEAANQTLSEKRAREVREYLIVYQEIPPARISAEGLGPSQPAATNTTEVGRALNRRVEIAVMTGE